MDGILKHWQILRRVRATGASIMKSHAVKHFFPWTEEENKAVKLLDQFSSNINPFQTTPNHSKSQVCEKVNCLRVHLRLFSPRTSCWLLAAMGGWELLLNLIVITYLLHPLCTGWSSTSWQTPEQNTLLRCCWRLTLKVLKGYLSNLF